MDSPASTSAPVIIESQPAPPDSTANRGYRRIADVRNSYYIAANGHRVRRSASSNPVIAELMSTVAHARDRKRQREQRIFQQREDAFGAGAVENKEESTSETGERPKKRERTEEEPSSSTDSEGSSSTPEREQRPEREVFQRPIQTEAMRIAMRTARRNAQRNAIRRQQQETLRIHLEANPAAPYMQQILGNVPHMPLPEVHQCDLQCQLRNHMPASSAGRHAVSPTVATGLQIRHPLTPSHYPFYPTLPLSSSAPVIQPVLLGVGIIPPLVVPPHVAIQQAAAQQQHQIAVQQAAAQVLNSSAQQFHAAYSRGIEYPVPPAPPPPPAPFNPIPIDYFTSFIRAHQEAMMWPTTDLYGLDRHHMFAGFDLDVPVGASKSDIEDNTVVMKYEKEEPKIPEGTENEEKKEDDEEPCCTVCLSEYVVGEDLRKLRCKHIFHQECIDKWLDINKRCPMCREDIDERRSMSVAGSY